MLLCISLDEASATRVIQEKTVAVGAFDLGKNQKGEISFYIDPSYQPQENLHTSPPWTAEDHEFEAAHALHKCNSMRASPIFILSSENKFVPLWNESCFLQSFYLSPQMKSQTTFSEY